MHSLVKGVLLILVKNKKLKFTYIIYFKGKHEYKRVLHKGILMQVYKITWRKK